MRPPTSPARARRDTTAPPSRGARPRHGGFVRSTTLAAFLAAALAAPAAAARAQADAATDPALPLRVQRAFDPALTLSLTTTTFGTRSADARADYSYTSGLGVAATLQGPLTRRTGVMLDASLVPGAKQQASSSDALGLVTASHTAIVTADVGLAARLKADAPVFFFAGGGVIHASRVATPLGDGAANEPRATVALGWDFGLHSTDRLGVRALVAAHLTKPADPGLADMTVKSLAADYTFRLGVRWRLSESALR